MWNIPLGMNVKENPLVISPFGQGQSNGGGVVPPSPFLELVTEGGDMILTEGMTQITTE